MTRSLVRAGLVATGYIGGASVGWLALVFYDFWRLAHRKPLRTPHLATRRITWP